MPTRDPSAASITIDGMRRLLDDARAAADWGRRAGLTDPATAQRVLLAIAEGGVTLDLLGSLAARLLSILPETSEPDRCLRELARYVAAARNPLSAVALFDRDPASLAILMRIFSTGPFLSSVVVDDPEAWEQVRLGEGRPESRESLAAEARALTSMLGDADAVMQSIRRFKRRELLRIAYGDVVSGHRLETVTSQLSHLADAVLAAAVDASLRRVSAQWGTPREPSGRPATLAVMALGKLGGRELNYSSDIDLVFVYSADGRVEGPRSSTNHEFFERVVREVVRLVGGTNELGIAYRVDLRLRPLGEKGPAAMSFDATLQHFDEHGRTWQRQAWLKARAAAGDETLGRRLVEQLEPWIFHRWLSRADISGIKALKRKIEHRARMEGAEARDVKIGRGGIRDIEFAIQFLQLLNGGDSPQVRTPNTLDAIRRLAEAGALTDQERGILEANYTLLRSVEHRLQILCDLRTHSLPESDDERGRLAVRMGHTKGPEGLAAFDLAIAEATSLDRQILDHLLHDAFPDEPDPEPEVDLVLDPDPDPATVHELLGRHGFRDPAAAYRHLQSLAEEKIRFLSTRRCRHFLAAIAPRLLAAIGKTPDPDATLVNLATVSESLGGKGVLWELFSFHPPSLELYVSVCASSPFLSGILVGNPGMIDELLDCLMIGRLPTRAELEQGLDELCRGAVDLEPILHAFKASQQLRIGVRDVLGKQDVTQTTAALSDVAETVLRKLVAREEAKLVERLGEPMAGEGSSVGMRAEPVVLAMGKFGGREMNYHSDVDLVFLYDHDGITFQPRRGRKTADCTTNAHFFSELARRVLKASNAFGPYGRLYEMDSRLRPSGRSGATAISLDAFDRYFAPDGPAAVWERQALTKARVVVGSQSSTTRTMEIVARAAYERDWTADEIEAIRRMRYRMEEGAAVTNLKRGPGGVVDIEFVVQALQLVHGGGEAAVRVTETLRGLEALHHAGHVGDGRFEFFETAYRVLRAIEGRLRLMDAAARHEFPESTEEQRKLAHLLGYASTEQLTTDVHSLTARTRREFEAVFNELAASPTPRRRAEAGT